MYDSKYRLGILATHPVQYYVPWYRKLAEHPSVDLRVFYCHFQTPREQARAGFNVEFKWDIPLLDGYKCRFLRNRARHPNTDRFFGCDTPEITRYIYKGAFDAFIVHGWHVKSFWQAMRACRESGVPIFVKGDSYLVTNRFFIKRWFKYPLYKWFIPKFDGYLAVGKHAKDYYLHYGASEKKIFFVPHAVDNRFFASRSALFASEREKLRKVWGIPCGATVFLFAGKLIQKKRPHDFIKALQLARQRCPGVFGLITGDGPLRAELEKTVKKKNLPVVFTGFLNQGEIPKAYAVSDVLVLPSDTGETWGLVANEAMASGLPVIVSDRVGSLPDLISPGKTGEVFRCGDIKRLAEIIIEFTLKPEMIEYMAKNAKRLIDEYSFDSAVSGTLKAVDFVIHEGKYATIAK